jgi:hypothetical protein
MPKIVQLIPVPGKRNEYIRRDVPMPKKPIKKAK